jgi:hypothetical protein
MGPAGRYIPGNLTSADAEGRITFAPGARLLAPPPGLTVRRDVQRSRATWAFYTDTIGSDEDDHWILERPRVLRRQEERRVQARIGLSEEDGLRLVVPVRVEIRRLRLVPAGNQTRFAGARIWCLDDTGGRWWDR